MEELATAEFDFLSAYQILEKAAVTKSAAEISAINSVAIAELINTIDPLINTSTKQPFGIPISESRKESTSTRDNLVAMVAQGYLNSKNKVFSMPDVCLLPKQILNVASWKKSKYHKKPIIGKLPVLQNNSQVQLLGSGATEGKSSGIITLEHGARIRELKLIKERRQRELLETKNHHDSEVYADCLEIPENSSKSSSFMSPNLPERARNGFRSSSQQDPFTPPSKNSFVSRDSSYFEDKENIQLEDSRKSNRYYEIPDYPERKNVDNGTLKHEKMMVDLREMMEQNSSFLVKNFKDVRNDINEIKNGEVLLTPQLCDELGNKIVRSGIFEQVVKKTILSETKGLSLTVQLLADGNSKSHIEVEQLKASLKALTKKVQSLSLNEIELNVSRVSKHDSNDKDLIIRIFTTYMNECADYSMAMNNKRNLGFFRITIVDHSLFEIDDNHQPQVKLGLVKQLIPFDFITTEQNPRLSKNGNVMCMLKVQDRSVAQINKKLDRILYERVDVCKNRILFSIDTPTNHNIDAVMKTWQDKKIIFSWQVNGRGMLYLVIRDGKAMYENDHTKKTEYTRSCTRLFVKNPKQVASIIEPSITQLRNMVRGVIFPSSGYFYPIPAFHIIKQNKKYPKPNYISPHFTDQIEEEKQGGLSENQNVVQLISETQVVNRRDEFSGDNHRITTGNQSAEQLANKIHGMKSKNGSFGDNHQNKKNGQIDIAHFQPVTEQNSFTKPMSNFEIASYQPTVHHRNNQLDHDVLQQNDKYDSNKPSRYVVDVQLDDIDLKDRHYNPRKGGSSKPKITIHDNFRPDTRTVELR